MAQDRADAFLRMIRRSQMGRLKIYLGYAAGVGKTYEMLQEAHRLKEEGIDVAVGLVETHGRKDTANLLEGLEVIPRRKQEYQGITLEEMDLDAVLARKPQIVLVDELAHTNVPGSQNPKRYQDVQDILAQGIHVITTLNIQHLESLYDIVERASGVKVHERLPDSVLSEADQIVNVDVTFEDLNERLKEGKIYPQERVQTALANFFKKSNLTQLRELTLRELASQIDLQSRDILEEDRAATHDQVMVCLSSRGPNSEKLLRFASRIAGRLNRSWYAVYVQTPSEEPTVIDARTQRLLSDTLTLAKQLGALVFTFKGEDVVKTILQFAKEYRVGRIILGTPEKIPFWKWLFGKRSIMDRLVSDARGITIVVLDTREPEAPHTPAFGEKVPLERPVPESSVSAENGRVALSRYLSPGRIVIWNEPIKKDDVLRELTEAAACGMTPDRIEGCFDVVCERENQGSTFYNEGVAFPHARIEGLEHSCVSLGLTHGGVSDVQTDKPIECVFLILSPAENPEQQIQILGLASRLAQDRRLMVVLRNATSSDEVFDAIQDWEFVQEHKAAEQ